MPTFLTAVTDLLDYVNRPSSEALSQAKRELNNTIRWLQRRYNFKYAEKLASFTYASGVLSYNLTDICGGLLKRLESVQLMSGASDTRGQNLEFHQYKQIQKMKFDYIKRHEDAAEGLTDANDRTRVTSFEDYVTRTHRYYAFTVGKTFGLFPTPGSDAQVLIHATIWTNDLSADADTHYLLDYCYDAVLDLAAARYTDLYLKDDSRMKVTSVLAQLALASIESWDAQVSESYNG